MVFLDGSLYYFEGKHLYYALPALACTLLVVVPLPLLLFCDPFLIKCESLLTKYHFLHQLQPWTSFPRKLKPVFDTFQGCFRDEHRYFAGLYFAYRLLFIAIPSVLDSYFPLEFSLIVLLVVQAMVMPFELPEHNSIAILVFFCLLLISTLTINILAHVHQHGYTTYVTLLQWIRFFFACSPIIFCIFVTARPLLAKAKRGIHSYQQSAGSVRDEQLDHDVLVLDTLFKRMDDTLKDFQDTKQPEHLSAPFHQPSVCHDWPAVVDRGRSAAVLFCSHRKYTFDILCLVVIGN